MRLLPTEQVLAQAAGGTLTLTTQRVVYEWREGDHNEFSVILLGDLCYCRTFTERKRVWLMLAILAAGLGLLGLNLLGSASGSRVSDVTGAGQVLAFVGALGLVLFLLLYFLDDRGILLLASAGGNIPVPFRKFDTAREFIHAVHAAKLAYLAGTRPPWVNAAADAAAPAPASARL